SDRTNSCSAAVSPAKSTRVGAANAGEEYSTHSALSGQETRTKTVEPGAALGGNTVMASSAAAVPAPPTRTAAAVQPSAVRTRITLPLMSPALQDPLGTSQSVPGTRRPPRAGCGGFARTFSDIGGAWRNAHFGSGWGGPGRSRRGGVVRRIPGPGVWRAGRPGSADRFARGRLRHAPRRGHAVGGGAPMARLLFELAGEWKRLAGPGREAAAVGAELLARWAEPHRRYHTLDHLK